MSLFNWDLPFDIDPWYAETYDKATLELIKVIVLGYVNSVNNNPKASFAPVPWDSSFQERPVGVPIPLVPSGDYVTTKTCFAAIKTYYTIFQGMPRTHDVGLVNELLDEIIRQGLQVDELKMMFELLGWPGFVSAMQVI